MNRFLKWGIPILAITLPFWLGLSALVVGNAIGSTLIGNFGFYVVFFAQFAQFQYLCFWNEAGRLSYPWVFIAVHWLVVFAAYGLLSRGRSTGRSWAVFAVLAIGSVVLVFIAMGLLGYEFEPEAI